MRDAEVIATSSDHSNMVKFRGADDEGFMAVTKILEIMRQETKQRVDANREEDEELPKVRDRDDPNGLGLRNIYVAFFLLAIGKG